MNRADDEYVPSVRVRPPTSWESARLPEPCYDTTIRGDGTLAAPGKPATTTAPLRDIVQIVDDRILTFDPEERDKARAFVERGFLPPGTKRYKDKRFMFDRVFDGDARQGEVYSATAKPLLNRLLDGYNATVFAYGVRSFGYPGMLHLLTSATGNWLRQDPHDQRNRDGSRHYLSHHGRSLSAHRGSQR